MSKMMTQKSLRLWLKMFIKYGTQKKASILKTRLRMEALVMNIDCICACLSGCIAMIKTDCSPFWAEGHGLTIVITHGLSPLKFPTHHEHISEFQ
jgi:hypothetical protein